MVSVTTAFTSLHCRKSFARRVRSRSFSAGFNDLCEYSVGSSSTERSQSSQNSRRHTDTLAFVALEPGSTAQIQAGDISLAHKVWKKRRRSESPLLVPCSILSVDRFSSIRWNILYLTKKFGSSSRSSGKSTRISLRDLVARHRTHLKCSLTRQAASLGYNTTRDLVVALFPPHVQEHYEVCLLHGASAEDPLSLEVPWSRRNSQLRAASAAVLQFAFNDETSMLQHTGFARRQTRAVNGDEITQLYSLRPLSAALRVPLGTLDQIESNSRHTAFVLDYDSSGDSSEPLIVFALEPSRNNQSRRKRMATRQAGIRNL